MKHSDHTDLDQCYKCTAWSQEYTVFGRYCKGLCLELRKQLEIMAFQEPTAAQLRNTSPAAGQRYGLPSHTLLLRDVRSQKNLSRPPHKIVLN